MPEDQVAKLTLGELPVEVLLDDVFRVIPAHDLLRLGCTNKFFSTLCNDDTLWKNKLMDDFNFSGEGTARTSGYKFLYRGLDKPRVFAWGDKGNGRLGVDRMPKTVINGAPYPIQVKIPGVRIVSLVAGGMSFHALDSNGNVHVWGTLNGSWGPHVANSRGFSNPEKQARVPHRLQMPAPIRAISCGRLHASCWDRSNKIWTFTNWGRPFHLAAPILQESDFSPKQIECGWAFSALLTKFGDVFVWWPFDGEMGQAIQEGFRKMDEDEKSDTNAFPKDGMIPCASWALQDVAPTRLPSLPTLPKLVQSSSGKEQTLQLIQIAAFENHLVGLTNQGHVLKFGDLEGEQAVIQGCWEYLPRFSELRQITEDAIFSESSDSPPKVQIPKTLKITHISANFMHFVAYSTGSSSIVLLGDTETKVDTPPKIIPELQDKSVISVVIGDYHNAALTATGKLMTWGAYSNGALGLGDPAKLEPGTPGGFADDRARQFAIERQRGEPPPVVVPTEVRFDHDLKHPRERFCFAVTAAGWHTGALVIDLEPGDDEGENVALEETFPKPIPRIGGMQSQGRGRGLFTSPIVANPGLFRFGHAAAGMHQPPPPSDGGAS
ncbi:regulator of chromosome condensation 1/beta-lactamase-inhibitor protein II [Crepidotus variabilis]|uniref:Regulator of chromosome condensation 1/beta-lactamase-inhibitor protein II n=1 Tax=Crepidotus variabilis TaxID=179855 RepID=A0A9P6EAJ3_9AGAR|nr:regulator of chromosome condensation 1/beta-lactamase-inhibitor protein II [Crepidotus variabilis]